MPFVQMNTDDIMIPALIPRTADPAVVGVNSSWLIAGVAGAMALLAKPRGPKRPAPKKIKIGK